MREEQRGRNVTRRSYVFRRPSKLGESPFEQAEVVTLDDQGLSELKCQVRGICTCGTTFESPNAVKAMDAITGDHLCGRCAQSVCPDCSRVMSPVTSTATLFGTNRCSECAWARGTRLVLGTITLVAISAIGYGIWWLF